MLDLQYQFVKTILKNTSHSAQESGRAFAPANIALCKYWGKRNNVLNLPLNSSLSISLGKKGSFTEIKRSPQDKFFLNERLMHPESDFSERLSIFLNLFREICRAPGFEVHTTNTIPTSAGLASSASGFAALVLALNDLTGWQLDKKNLSMLARLGSGSASRSIFNGFVLWNAGKRKDGLDSFSDPIDVTWSEFRIGILKTNFSEKKVSSRLGMKRTVETSPRYRNWPKQAEEDFVNIYKAVKNKDFNLVGLLAEKNALEMHATMREANPPIDYFTETTHSLIKRVQSLRNQGLPIYLTIDAGPNVKILFEEKYNDDVIKEFPDVYIINPLGDI
ncbi:MAG: diphosphomevalonate decarboxylase [Pontiellaceae bacterium]